VSTAGPVLAVLRNPFPSYRFRIVEAVGDELLYLDIFVVLMGGYQRRVEVYSKFHPCSKTVGAKTALGVSALQVALSSSESSHVTK